MDVENILHPAQRFELPSDIVNARDLTLTEKRAFLASWASDACAIEAAPALRVGNKAPVPFDDIMSALQQLDRVEATAQGRSYRDKVHLRRRRPIDGRTGTFEAR